MTLQKLFSVNLVQDNNFSKDYGSHTRATNVSVVPADIRETIPKDTVLEERDFDKFDHVATLAKYCNKNFTANRVQEI